MSYKEENPQFAAGGFAESVATFDISHEVDTATKTGNAQATKTSHFKNQGRALLANGYQIIPIRRGEKRPAITAWQNSRLGMADLTNYPDHGVGVLCGQGAHPLCGVDIDISHPTIGPAVIAWCQQHLGYGGERVGAAPRILLTYLAAEAGWAKGNSILFFDTTDPVKPSGKRNDQQVEILGLGQQFVAYHEHPDTLTDYEWVDMMGGLEYLAAGDLPVVTGAQIEALLAEVARLVSITPGVEVSGKTELALYRGGAVDDLTGLTPRAEISLADMTDLLKYLPNDDAGYDTWAHVGMALHHEYADTADEADAIELWREYGARSSKDDPGQYGYKWRSFGKGGSAPTTVRWLIKVCNQAREKMSYVAKDEWVIQLKAASDEYTLRTKVCKQILEDHRLDGMARLSLAQSLSVAFKRLGTPYPIGQCRELLTPAASQSDAAAPVTHGGYAKGILKALQSEAGGHVAVGVEGRFFTVQASGCYEALTLSTMAVRVDQMYDGREKCERRSDYQAIAKHAYDVCERIDFFNGAPIGLVSPDGFYHVGAGGIELQPLSPAHRQRHMHAIGPRPGPMPIFERYLVDTFVSPFAGEQVEQIALLQEVAGAVALGLMARHEKAALLFGPGRSGKGTALKILEELVPLNSRASVSPFRWDQEYFIAHLAGKRVNLVGELPDDQPIPAAYFKSVLGRDLLTGRHPTHQPFEFRNEAAHIFNSNSYPNTRDHSAAFYTRWLILSFANSRIDRASIDTDLAARIVAREMPAVLAWALDGAQRLVQRGRFEETNAHSRHMAAWQRRTDSVMEFLHDEDVCVLDSLSGTVRCKRTTLYQVYTTWCGPAGRKPIGKQKFNDALDSPASVAIGLTIRRDPVLREVVHGVRLTEAYVGYDGYDVF